MIIGNLQPENILVNSEYQLRIIEWDQFLYYDDLFAVTFNLEYISPELFELLKGKTKCISEKTDVFSMALIFHKLFTGELPYFDRTKYNSVAEASSDGQKIILSDMLPNSIKPLFSGMLSKNENSRLSSLQVWESLKGLKQ